MDLPLEETHPVEAEAVVVVKATKLVVNPIKLALLHIKKEKEEREATREGAREEEIEVLTEEAKEEEEEEIRIAKENKLVLRINSICCLEVTNLKKRLLLQRNLVTLMTL